MPRVAGQVAPTSKPPLPRAHGSGAPPTHAESIAALEDWERINQSELALVQSDLKLAKRQLAAKDRGVTAAGLLLQVGGAGVTIIGALSAAPAAAALGVLGGIIALGGIGLQFAWWSFKKRLEVELSSHEDRHEKLLDQKSSIAKAQITVIQQRVEQLAGLVPQPQLSVRSQQPPGRSPPRRRRKSKRDQGCDAGRL